MLIGILQEDKFTNQPSLTMVKDDDLCKGKVLGCMEMTKLGIKLFCATEAGLATYKAECSRESRVEKAEEVLDVEKNGFPEESKLYCIGAIPNKACFSFLLNNHRNFDSSLLRKR